MNEIEEYLKVINDNIFIVIVLLLFIITGVMITINIGKWLIKIFKKYCL